MQAPSNIPASRPKTRLLTVLGVLLTFQLYDVVLAGVRGAYTVHLAIGSASLFLLTILYLRRHLHHLQHITTQSRSYIQLVWFRPLLVTLVLF